MRNTDDINANPWSTLNLVSRPTLARPCHVHITTWSGKHILAMGRSLRPRVGSHRTAGGKHDQRGILRYTHAVKRNDDGDSLGIYWKWLANLSPLFQPSVIRKYNMLYLWASPNLRASSSKFLCELAKAPCHARFPTRMVAQRLWARLHKPMTRHMYQHQTVGQR